MSDYIVYEKTTCFRHETTKSRPKCSTCGELEKTILKEVPLKDAVIDLLLTDPAFKEKVSSLTWTI